MEQNVIVAGIAMGFTEICKSIGLPSKYAPIASLVWGIGASLLVTGISINAVVIGIIAGLSASGLWDVGKMAVK